MTWIVIALIVVALVALSYGAKRKRRGGYGSGGENPEKSRWTSNGKSEYYGGGHDVGGGTGGYGGGAG